MCKNGELYYRQWTSNPFECNSFQIDFHSPIQKMKNKIDGGGVDLFWPSTVVCDAVRIYYYYTIRSAPVDNMFDIRIKVKLCRHWRKWAVLYLFFLLIIHRRVVIIFLRSVCWLPVGDWRMPFFKKCCHITSLSYTLGKRMFYRLLLLLPYSCWPGWMVSGCAIRVQNRAHVPSCKACGSRGRSSIFLLFLFCLLRIFLLVFLAFAAAADVSFLLFSDSISTATRLE